MPDASHPHERRRHKRHQPASLERELLAREGDRQQWSRAQTDPRPPRPAQRLPLRERQHQTEQRRRQQRGPGAVDRRRILRASFGDPPQQRQTGDPHGHVDEEDRAPPATCDISGDNQPAQRLARDHRQTGSGTVEPDRAGAAVLIQRGVEGGEHLGHHHCRRGALQHASTDEGQDVRGEPAQQRADGEPRHPRCEQAAAPVAVSEATPKHEQQRVSEAIARNNKLERGVAGVEVATHGGECDVDNEEVGHRQREAE
jgi:hypothetical protein